MNRQRQGRRRWCKGILKGIAVLVVLVLVAFGVIEGLLTTSWARGKAAAKVSNRVGGLPVEIDRLAWTPWGGASVEGLKIEQPDELADSLPAPLLEVDRIHVWPDYRAALGGKLSAHEVRVERPRLLVSAEMLASIAAASLPQVKAPDATVAANPKIEGKPVIDPASAETAGEPEAADEVAAAEGKPSSPEPAKPLKEVRKRIQIRVDEGSFALVTGGRPEPLAALEGVTLDLPLFGDVAESDCSVRVLRANGQTIETDLESKVKSSGTTLNFRIPDDRAKQSKVYGHFALGLKQRLPFQIGLNLRLEGLERTEVNHVFAVESGELEARVQGVGWLQVPSSWSGVWRFSTRDVAGSLFGQASGFDSASGSVQLSGGVIQSPEFRLIGDSAALIGNGWVTAQDGSMVVRVLVPYPVVGLLNSELVKRVPDGSFAFRPLNPDNRWYSDVSLWRRNDGWAVEFGAGGSELAIGAFKKTNRSGDLPVGPAGGKE